MDRAMINNFKKNLDSDKALKFICVNMGILYTTPKGLISLFVEMFWAIDIEFIWNDIG